MSSLYSVLTQKTINTLIYKMVGYIKFNIDLNLINDLTNDYCTLELNLNDNVVSGDEIIVNNSLQIDLSNEKFNELNYYLKLNYYELDADIDDRYDGELKTKTIQLNNGTNSVEFTKYPSYLQGESVLIVKE